MDFLASFSVDQFCQRHGISRTLFYELIKQGKGPRRMKVGRRTLISVDADAEWQKSNEAETAREATS